MLVKMKTASKCVLARVLHCHMNAVSGRPPGLLARRIDRSRRPLIRDDWDHLLLMLISPSHPFEFSPCSVRNMLSCSPGNWREHSPRDAATGTWPIMFHRVPWGWGLRPEEAWPCERDGRLVWPPRDEPPDIDALAHQNLGGSYQRVRSLHEFKLVVAHHSSVLAVLDVTDKGYDAPQGRIPEYHANEVPTGTHSVCAPIYRTRMG